MAELFVHRDPWADVLRVMVPYNAEGVSADGLTVNVHSVRAGYGAAAHLERDAAIRLRDALTGWLDETAAPETCSCTPCTWGWNGHPTVEHCAACCGGSQVAEYNPNCSIRGHREMAARQFPDAAVVQLAEGQLLPTAAQVVDTPVRWTCECGAQDTGAMGWTEHVIDTHDGEPPRRTFQTVTIRAAGDRL